MVSQDIITFQKGDDFIKQEIRCYITERDPKGEIMVDCNLDHLFKWKWLLEGLKEESRTLYGYLNQEVPLEPRKEVRGLKFKNQDELDDWMETVATLRESSLRKSLNFDLIKNIMNKLKELPSLSDYTKIEPLKVKKGLKQMREFQGEKKGRMMEGL